MGAGEAAYGRDCGCRGARPVISGRRGGEWRGRDHGRSGGLAAGSPGQEEARLDKMETLLLILNTLRRGNF